MVFINACAAIQSPPGGPKDETPPELIETIPANGTILFEGGRIELIFSEYVDENSVEKAIRILPTMDPPPEIIYKGRRVFVEMPDSLAQNQTYIVSIDRTLKDEHKVPLAQGIQVAFATGNKIDEGQISGRVFHEDPSSVHLWRVEPNDTLSSVYLAQPDYVVDASDEGVFEFNYLSNGDYRLIAVDRLAAGAVLSSERMKYGLPWMNSIQVSETQHQILDVQMMIPPSRQGIKMSSAKWMNGAWGTLTFSSSISDIFSRLKITAIDEDSVEQTLTTFMDSHDDLKLHFVVSGIENQSYLTLKNQQIIEKDDRVVEEGFIKIKVDTTQDTTFTQVTHPGKKFTLNIEEDETVMLPISFNRHINTDSSSNAFSLKQDTLPIPFNVQWKSPLTVELIPLENWLPKKEYSISIFRDSLLVIHGRSLADSMNTISFKTSTFQGYGQLLGSVENSERQPLIAEITSMEKEPKQFRTVVNSNSTFTMNRIPEGNYSLLFFQDSHENQRYSYGRVEPFQPAEWFYHYPDTVKIRTNWDLELNQIKLEHIP